MDGTSLADGCSVSVSDDGFRVVLGTSVIDGAIVGGIVAFAPSPDATGAFVVVFTATATGAGTATGTVAVGTLAIVGANVVLFIIGVIVGNSGTSSKDVNTNDS